MYMAINRMLVPPSVKGVPLNTIMDFLRKQSPHKAHTVLMENEIAPYEHEQGVMEEIKKGVHQNGKMCSRLLPRSILKECFYSTA